MKIFLWTLVTLILNIAFHITMSKYLLVGISEEDTDEELDPRKATQTALTDEKLDVNRALKRRDVMETCCQKKGVPNDCLGMCRNKREAPFQSRSLERFHSRCAGLEHEIYSCYAESISKVPEPETTVPNVKKPRQDVVAEACNGKQCGDSCCGPECGWKEVGRCNYDGECWTWPESLGIQCKSNE